MGDKCAKLYVPNLRKNLFSEGVIMRKGFSIIEKGVKALIYKNEKVVMSAEIKVNNLYELNIKTVIPKTCNLVQKDKKTCAYEILLIIL